MIERRDTDQPVEIRETEGEAARIEGHAAVYYDGSEGSEYRLWDDAVERIMPAAFTRALEDGDDTRALFNHDPSLLLGRSTSGTLTMSADERGLKYSIQPGDTSVARDVLEHLRRGDVSGSSFAFTVTDEEWRMEDGTAVREVTGVRLFDVGPVTYPAYAGSSSGVRSAEDAGEARASFDAWRTRPIPGRKRRARVLQKTAERDMV